MNGKEFIRKASKLGRKTGVPVKVLKNRGKGGHQVLVYGERKTTVKTGEIGMGLLAAMLKQLNIDPHDF